MENEDDLWNWASAAYARAEVQKSCLRLQDEFGINVNIVLACVWAAVQGSELGADDIVQLLRESTLRRERVHALRTVRRATRDCDGADDFYAALKAAELAGEQWVCRGLQAWLRAHPRPTEGVAADLALRSLRVYAERAEVWPKASDTLQVVVDVALAR